jgi:hypothetical protein
MDNFLDPYDLQNLNQKVYKQPKQIYKKQWDWCRNKVYNKVELRTDWMKSLLNSTRLWLNSLEGLWLNSINYSLK